MSTLTVRLTEREERELQLACERTGKTKSEVVRELLAESLRVYRLRAALQAAHAQLGPAAGQSARRAWLVITRLVQQETHEVLGRKFAHLPQALVF
jgi:hypothetical protein